MTRSKSNPWMTRHVNDPYVKRATVEGLRSRAAYKLMQINDRDKLIRPGMLVVDLGAAPGGWSQMAARIVAPAGRVIAIDLLEMAPLPAVTFIRGDFSEAAGLAALEQALGGAAVDLVLSDMAPNITGIAIADQSRFMGLLELALDFAVKHLKPGGCLLVKGFQGAGFEAFVQALRTAFRVVQTRKPDASRKGSREVYLLAKGVKGPGSD
jgi:23S rRNA (uridine2552-2'-O)-methyltransferase